jgi:gliding motility-associated-like protein
VTNTNGCISRSQIKINVDNELKLYFPNIFSPNGDGVNDKLIIGKNKIPADINRISIFDRYGNMVYNQKNVLFNDDSDGWDGRFNNDYVVAGVYVMIIELTDYLIDVETSLTHLGGTFSIKLAHKPIMNIYGEESSEIYRGKDLSKIQGGYKEMTLYDDEIDIELRRRGFNFNVSENDIVFICKKQFSVDTKYNPLDIPIDFFWNNVSSFYMIGLIDASSSITDYKNSNIVLSGRDLSKLLIEDGTYWYQYSVSSGENNIFQNGNDSKGGDEAGIFKDNKDENGKTLQERMFLSGLIMQLTNFEEKSILGVMQIFINTLSNVQICPDNVITDKFNIM